MAESFERRKVLGYGVATGAAVLAGVVGAADLGRPRMTPAEPVDAGTAPGGTAEPMAARLEPPPEAFDTTPARQALRRLLPAHAEQIDLVAVPARDEVDRYRITGPSRPAPDVAVAIEGTSTAALLAGAGWYLKYLAGVTVSLPGDSLGQLPERLPAPSTAVSGAAVVQHRFALNDTENGYAGAYRTWADWQRLLDVLALHGCNEVLVPLGQDEVYRRVFAEFGYQPEELDAWLPAPAYQPWWLLANLQGVAGPTPPEVRAAGVSLVRDIVARLRELGLAPVLPGYAGMVPPGFARRHPGAPVVPQGDWDGYQRPDWLDTRDPLYARIAESFYRHQDELYGSGTAYKMDLLHEGGTSGGVPIGAAAVAVMTALQTARPGATWVMLGWQDNPRREVLDAVRACGLAACRTGRVLVVDGISDRGDTFDREGQWGGTAYAFGTITNFGGRSLLGANAPTWADRYPKALARPGSALAGTAWLPEASGHDPAAFELFTELAWRADPVDLADWFDRYAARRYGRRDDAAAQAWQAFARTAYALAPGPFSQAQDSLFCAWPDLSATAAAPDGPGMRYDGAAFQDGVLALLRADPALRAADAYRYDVVDFTRQALANHARVLLPRIKAAYVGRDLAGYRELTGRWLDAMRLLDALLATDERFLLGTWLRSGGYDARSLITTWGGRKPAAALHNYGARELAGLVADVYLPRWRRHFAAYETVITGAATDLAAADWYAADDAWARSGTGYPTTATGDPFAAANAVLALATAP
ncbi:alpha-N-acetylglucosaminidase [Catenulispora yoronensis]|uniref:Alpha-N-acetylglucosaminidase n=1 Tax=Catenulispora yoronensis TaxID=450799 RepID=A0ABP5F078_9ACTN